MKSKLLKPLLIGKSYILLAIMVLSISFADAQNCESKLTVRNNFNSRSIDKDGAKFILVLTNNSSNDATYTLQTEFDFCQSHMKGDGNFHKQLPVEITFENNNNIKGNSNIIEVAANSSKNIFIKVKTTPSTPIDTYGCLKVYAKNKYCNSDSLYTNLQLIVPNPKGDD